MDTKSLSSKYVYWAQKLSSYHFKSIINSPKLIELLMPCPNILSRILRKKKSSKLRI